MIDLKLVEEHLKQFIENRALNIITPEPYVIQGFGLARLKEESIEIKYANQIHLYFPNDGYFIKGKVSPYKLERLLLRAYSYINKTVGFYRWENLAWRALPEFIQERDFEIEETYTKLIFRCSLFDK